MTTYALVENDTIVRVGPLPQSYKQHSGLQYASAEFLASIGILPVVDTPRSVELVAGVPTVVWVERLFTADELAARAAAVNAATMRAEVDQALDGLRQIANSSGTLTGTQLSNAVRLLARVMIRVIRFQLSKLDAVD
jgi:hypothetical protein